MLSAVWISSKSGLGKRLEVLLETESKQLKMVDARISYFVRKLAAYPLPARLSDRFALALIKYICSLLAKRHEYLVQDFIPARYKRNYKP